LSARTRYIRKTVLLYLIFAFSWVLLSDQLMLLLLSPELLVEVSTAKGLFFVVLTASVLVLALRAVPGLSDPTETLIVPERAGWRSYALALVLVVVVLIFQKVLPIDEAKHPMMVIPLLPVMLAAALGGFGPGVLATSCAAAGIAYNSHTQLFGQATLPHLQLQWLFFWFNGLLVSWLCQVLRHTSLRWRQQQQQLQRVLQGAEQGFWELNWPAQQLIVSEKFETMLGYAPGSMDVRIANWPSLVHPDDFAGLIESLQKHLSGAVSAHEAEFRMRCKDGSWRWILTRGKIVETDHNGQPVILAGTHSDISLRHQAQHELRLAEQVFAGSYDAIMLVGADKRILRVNPAFCRITGYNEQQMIGRTPAVLASGLHDRHFYRQMWQQISEHDCWRGEIINKRRDGSLYSEMLSVSVVRDSQGQINQYIGIFTDISAQKAHAAELDKVANFDGLTGLPNRRLLLTRFNQLLISATQRDQRCAVCLLDLDNFKEINLQFGTAFGDKVLLALSQNLQAVLRHDDTLARLGGDEFVVLLADIPPLPEGNQVIKRLRNAVNQVLLIEQQEIQLTSSIGVSVYPDDNNDPDTLLRHADKAMFSAKERGRNRIQWFDPAHEQKAQEHRLLLDELHEALQQQQFELYYQPKVDMRQGTVFGVEALIRWHHPQRGLLSPAAFLPAIEGSELELAVGDWVLQQAVRQLATWQAQGLYLSVAINVSASQLLAPAFRQQLSDSLSQYPHVTPASLEVEILESTAIRDLVIARDAIHSCQQLGVRFALDDFGTGYSSLTYLRQLPVHCLKIDQSFVRDMLEDPEDRNIVSGVVQLAQVFSRDVIAEGVESIAHARQLIALGCYCLQGYGIARPMPATQLPGWIQQWLQQPEWQLLQHGAGQQVLKSPQPAGTAHTIAEA